MNPILASSLPAKRFIDPDSYNQSFHDLAVQHAALTLRNDSVYTLGQSLGTIGWRIRKHYFKATPKTASSGSSAHTSGGSAGSSSTGKSILTKSSSQSHSKLASATSLSLESQPKCLEGIEFPILTWTEYGPDKYVDDKEIGGALKSLATIQHPFIMPIDFVATNEYGALFVRSFYLKGSLKDLLYGTTPKNPYMQKYGNSATRGRGLPVKDIATYGRQILEALHFLHSKGLPFGECDDCRPVPRLTAATSAFTSQN